MAKIVGKASTIQQEIASDFTTIAGVRSIDVSGSKSLTYDSTDLSTSAPKTKAPTGYAEPATVKFEFFYDPGLSGHQSFTDLIEAPVSTNFKVNFSNGSSDQTFAGVGFGVDYKIEMDNAVIGTATIEASGTADWTT